MSAVGERELEEAMKEQADFLGKATFRELWPYKVVKPDPGQKKPRELKCRG